MVNARASRPFTECPPSCLREVRGLLTDIDDTLTSDGALTQDALDALHALRAARIAAIAITGRPMGWSAPFAREWPIDAIVAENGAVALLPDGTVEYAQHEATRNAHAGRLRAVARKVLLEVPGTTLARDSAGRVTDIAIDHSEFVRLPPDAIERVVALMRSEGMNATVSSIHINGWFGQHDKWSGARWIVQRLSGRALDDEIRRWVYVGDSTNDQIMFERFPLSVGVANLMRFERELNVWPAYLTRGERGAGFAEVARSLIDARR